MSKWRHDDLVRDLGEHLVAVSGRLAFLDMQLGPSGSPRPDVYSIQPSYARPNPLAYECKVTRSDFMSDVSAGKWMAYARFAAGVVFAVPRGLVDKRELPAGCGLIIRGENGWTTLRRPTLARVQIPNDALLKLLFDSDRARVRAKVQPRSADPWHVAERVRKALGQDVGRILRDRALAEDEIKEKQAEAAKWRAAAEEARGAAAEIRAKAQEEGRAAANRMWDDLAELAGLPPGTPWRAIAHRLREMRWRMDESAEIRHLRRCVDAARRALDEAADPIRGTRADGEDQKAERPG